MQPELLLEIVTPDATVLSETVDYVGLPGREGQLGIMPQHVPLLAALGIGELYYRKNGATVKAFVSGGFVDVSSNRVTVMAESAELAADIDFARAQRAKERAEALLQMHKEGIDETRAHAALQRAITRLNILRG